jgi:hypothetical protein
MDENLERVHYIFEYARLLTFKKYVCNDKNLIFDDKLKRKYAIAGLYWTRNKKKIKCAFCHFSLFALRAGDTDPIALHCRFQSMCPLYINKTRNIPIDKELAQIKFLQKPFYPDRSTFRKRYLTFTSLTGVKRPKDLAYKLSHAGYFKMDGTDTIRCFYCKVEAKYTDELWKIINKHGKENKYCRFHIELCTSSVYGQDYDSELDSAQPKNVAKLDHNNANLPVPQHIALFQIILDEKREAVSIINDIQRQLSSLGVQVYPGSSYSLPSIQPLLPPHVVEPIEAQSLINHRLQEHDTKVYTSNVGGNQSIKEKDTNEKSQLTEKHVVVELQSNSKFEKELVVKSDKLGLQDMNSPCTMIQTSTSDIRLKSSRESSWYDDNQGSLAAEHKMYPQKSQISTKKSIRYSSSTNLESKNKLQERPIHNTFSARSESNLRKAQSESVRNRILFFEQFQNKHNLNK